MARLVLLSIPENALAERLVRGMIESPDIAHVVPSSATVEWVAARPTDPCDCAMKADPVARRRRRASSRTGKDAFTKGRRFGWWLHAACKKPTRLVIERFAVNMIGGNYDLTPEILGDLSLTPNDLRQFPGGENWVENQRTRR